MATSSFDKALYQAPQGLDSLGEGEDPLEIEIEADAAAEEEIIHERSHHVLTPHHQELIAEHDIEVIVLRGVGIEVFAPAKS